MSKVCKLEPRGWPCVIEECPPGYFAWEYLTGYQIGFKSEYAYSNDDPAPQCYNEGGEYLQTANIGAVQPLEIVWEEE